MKKIYILLSIISSLLHSFDDSFLDDYHESVSEYYYRFLDSSTRFIYDRNQKNYEYIKEHNKLRIYLNNTIDENYHTKSSISVRANIKLPKISKNLYISVDKENDTSTDAIQNKSKVEKEKQSSRVGLKYYFLRKNSKKIYTKLGGRLKLDGSKFYIQLGANRDDKYHDISIYTYFHEYYYLKDSYFDTEFGIDFDKRLNDTFLLSQDNQISIDKDSQTYISNTLSLTQQLNSIVTLRYWTTITTLYDNRKLATDSVSLNLDYHRMLKKWIFIDIIPSIIKDLTKEKETYKYLHINFGFIF